MIAFTAPLSTDRLSDPSLEFSLSHLTSGEALVIKSSRYASCSWQAANQPRVVRLNYTTLLDDTHGSGLKETRQLPGPPRHPNAGVRQRVYAS